MALGIEKMKPGNSSTQIWRCDSTYKFQEACTFHGQTHGGNEEKI
jgi:hypothetical protein